MDYNCKCGFVTTDNKEYKRHMLSFGKKEPGLHGNPNKKTDGDKQSPKDKKTQVATRTDKISEAVRIRIIPREFILDSGNLFWQAMEVAINEWGWPEDIRPQDFLDTYLYITMKQRGIILGGYQVEEQEGELVEAEVS